MSLIVSGVVRITKDLELKQAGTTTVCNFSVAKNKAFNKQGEEKQANFYDCVVFGKTAENLCKYKSKGEQIYIEGTYEVEKWVNDEGQNRYAHKIHVRNIEFIGSANTSNNNSNQSFEPKGLDPQGFQEIDSDDIPF